MVTETANFDFRDKPRKGGRSGEEKKQKTESWKNGEDTKSRSWLEEGMDVVKKIENEGRSINIFDGRS